MEVVFMFKRFINDKSGNFVIETIIVLALIATIVLALFPGLRGKMLIWANQDGTQVDNGIDVSNRYAPKKAAHAGESDAALQVEIIPYSNPVSNPPYPQATMLQFSAKTNRTGHFTYTWSSNYASEGMTDGTIGIEKKFPPGNNSVSVTAKDVDTGETSTISYNFTVTGAQSISNIHVYDSSNTEVSVYYADQPLKFKPDINPAGTYTCTWFSSDGTINNYKNNCGTTPTFQFAAGDVNITVEVCKDTICSTGTKKITVTNNDVVINSYSPNPASMDLYQGESQSFSVTPGGGSGRYTYNWTVSGGSYTESVANNTSNFGPVKFNDVATYTVTVIVCDLYDSGNCTDRIFTVHSLQLFITATYPYTGSYQTFVVPNDGNYQIEAWGAKGGNSFSGTGGNGGYTKGEIYLTKGTILYLYVGQYGQSGGWNGGAYGGATGGGASDVRTASGNWNDTTSLRSRILVAGGGGGGERIQGGAGGGLVGGNGAICYNSSIGYTCTAAGGGSQTAGGAGGWTSPFGYGYAGGFGYGGAGAPSGIDAGGAGGGGYYGGGGITYANGGGGGSSFISGCPGCNAVNASGTPTGQPNHFSGYIFHNTVLERGTNTDNDGKITITRIGTYSYTYTGSAQTWTVPADGTYTIETWGAQGGGEDPNSTTVGSRGGAGGYSKGTIHLTAGTKFYVYVGGEGDYAATSGATYTGGGWNGGGNAATKAAGSALGSGGGGATDVRTTSGAWNDATSLRSRIMVAGGGGGTDDTNISYPPTASGTYGGANDGSGGNGGGLTGQKGYNDGSLYFGAGSQTASNTPGNAGSFGIGGNGSITDAGGGGGGYYGGSGSTSNQGGGGGGSSFVSGCTGCNAVNSSGIATGLPNHYSGYVFTGITMNQGGHTGDGKAVITVVSLD
jgi:hypothetical protein